MPPAINDLLDSVSPSVATGFSTVRESGKGEMIGFNSMNADPDGATLAKLESGRE